MAARLEGLDNMKKGAAKGAGSGWVIQRSSTRETLASVLDAVGLDIAI